MWEALDLIARTHERDAREAELDKLWYMFVRWHKDDVLLAHPSYHPESESKLIYMPPLIGISTAAYCDVEHILQKMYEDRIVGAGQSCVISVGDQQTFSRMWHLKLEEPQKYSWLIPASGDFHFQFHFASAIHRLSYDSILKWFVDAADMKKTVPQKMDDTCHMKYIDHFYQLLIKVILTYLTDVYGEDYLAKKPSEILEEQKANNGNVSHRTGPRTSTEWLLRALVTL